MKKWEYCREYLSKLIGHGNEFTINKPGEVDKAINDMGEKGWELVSVANWELTQAGVHNVNTAHFIFKRKA